MYTYIWGPTVSLHVTLIIISRLKLLLLQLVEQRYDITLTATCSVSGIINISKFVPEVVRITVQLCREWYK